jgi:aminoglycoside 6'-N-acetyltransferase
MGETVDMLTSLRGDQTVLRPPVDDDIDALTRILAHPEVARWWEGYDRDRVRDELLAEGDGGSFAIVPLAPDGSPAEELVGFIQYYEQEDPDYRHAGIDLFVDPDHSGRGVGRDAIVTLARYLVDRRAHHRIIIDPSASNERAIAVFKAIGFREVGIMRRYERRADGTWGDNMLLELLADELPAPTTDRR